MSTLAFVSFPAELPCEDLYCPTTTVAWDNGEDSHTHTVYNHYGIPERDYRPGMTEIDASLYASVIRPNEIMPVAAVKESVNA